jgi:hypothetical protein
MDRDTDIREQNGGSSREAAVREIEEIRKLEKQLADMKTRFTAGTLTSEVYLKKKITIEKRITGLREKVKAAAAKQKEKGKPLSNNKKIYTIIIIAVIVTGAAVWGLLSLAGGPSTGYDAGMRAPGFSFQTTSNSQATLNDYKGRQVVLTVWDCMEKLHRRSALHSRKPPTLFHRIKPLPFSSLAGQTRSWQPTVSKSRTSPSPFSPTPGEISPGSME